MDSSGPIIVLLAPVLVPFAFGAAALWSTLVRGRSDAGGEREGLSVYALFVSGLAAVVLANAVPGDVLADWMSAPGTNGIESASLLAGGVVLGAVLYLVDLSSARFARSRARGTSLALLEGASRAINSRRLSWWPALVLSAAIVISEELLWRGALLDGTRRAWGFDAAAAVSLSALAFGAYHYVFGLRNVALKTVHGGAWGVATVITGSLTVAIASHLAFNALALGRGARGTVAVRVGG